MEKLPQNIQALIGEIGEKQVLLRLAILVHQTPGWEVFYNLGEAGYDVLLLKSGSNERIRIEVKARQRLYTTGKTQRRVNFFLTNGEYQACDFLIAYFIDHNRFYIVPRTELKPTQVNGRVRWRFTLSPARDSSSRVQYLDAWETLHIDFKSKPTLIEDDNDISDKFISTE
jgi:hypothetical protein